MAYSSIEHGFPIYRRLSEFHKQTLSHRTGGNLKLLRESTNADRKRLKIVFSIANYRLRLPICTLKRCFNAHRSALFDSCESSRFPHILYDLSRWSTCPGSHSLYKGIRGCAEGMVMLSHLLVFIRVINSRSKVLFWVIICEWFVFVMVIQ